MASKSSYDNKSPFSFEPNDGAPVQFDVHGERSDRTPNLYMLSWYYVANAGSCLMWASSAEEAYKRHIYSSGPARFVISQVDPDSLPLTFGGAE